MSRLLIESAEPTFFRDGEAQIRLTAGQELLDVRDAIKTALVAVGRLPAQRFGTRSPESARS